MALFNRFKVSVRIDRGVVDILRANGGLDDYLTNSILDKLTRQVLYTYINSVINENPFKTKQDLNHIEYELDVVMTSTQLLRRYINDIIERTKQGEHIDVKTVINELVGEVSA